MKKLNANPNQILAALIVDHLPHAWPGAASLEAIFRGTRCVAASFTIWR